MDSAGQADGYSSHTANVPGSLNDSSKPWNKTTSKTRTPREENPAPSLAKLLETRHELTNSTTSQNHMNQEAHLDKSHKASAPVRPVMSTGQTGQSWAARDEQRPRVNFPKSNSQSSKSLHGFAQDFGDSRNTSWALHSQNLVHQNLLSQEKSKKSHQERL
jgi:hypothetical protein